MESQTISENAILDLIGNTEYERLHGIREDFIHLGKNEDSLYGVYCPREQRLDEHDNISLTGTGPVEFNLIPDVLCVNLGDISPIEGIERFSKDITILDGGEIRKGNIKVLAGKPLSPVYEGLKLLRLSAGTIELATSKNAQGEEHIHIPTVHRGRTGFPHAWDMRTTSAGGALHADLSKECLREAIEESGIIGINQDGEFELCLPHLEGVNQGTAEQWMNYAIDIFLKKGGKYELFIGDESGHKGDQGLKEAGEYARKVFSRNFHGSTEKFTPGVLKSILLSIKEGHRYSYRNERTMTESDAIIQDIGSTNFRKVIVHDGEKSFGGNYWIDNDPATFHVFHIKTDVTYPKGFRPIFRFYSESGVHYQRNPRIEQLATKPNTEGLSHPTSIDMKPVPFLEKFALQVVQGRTRRRINGQLD